SFVDWSMDKEETMSRSSSLFARLASVTVGFVLVFATLLVGAAPQAHAGPAEFTLFRAEFDSAPQGPLSGPLTVEQGQVVPQAGAVSVASATTGRALRLDGGGGQSTALMQWINYPNGLPISTTQELNLRVTGDFTTGISNTTNASFGLLSGG